MYTLSGKSCPLNVILAMFVWIKVERGQSKGLV